MIWLGELGGAITVTDSVIEGNGGDARKQLGGIKDTQANGATAGANFYSNIRTRNVAAGGLRLVKTGNTPAMYGPLPYKQAITGVGTQTFYGTEGDLFYLTVNANTASVMTASNLIQGHRYEAVILNSSGATPAITLDTMFKIDNYAAPANGKYRHISMVYDGTNLIGQSSGDI